MINIFITNYFIKRDLMSKYFYYFLLIFFPVIFLTGCCNKSCKKNCIKSKAVILEDNDELKEKAKNAVDTVHEVIEDTILK